MTVFNISLPYACLGQTAGALLRHREATRKGILLSNPTCAPSRRARAISPRMSWERLHERVATARKLGCSEECPFATLAGVSKALRRFGLGNAQGRGMLTTGM